MVEQSTIYIIVNAADIIFTSLIIYSVLVFLRRIRYYAVFLGMVILIALYGLAKYFNMPLTLLTLQYFVGASAVLFAVVFQTEIRKYLEVVGLIGTRQIRVKNRKMVNFSASEIIVACIEMAKSKTGALLVIQGKDDIERFLEGGTSLDGVISEELIVSMFNKNIEFHDGAMIISDNRILKFGAQLPLSTNFKEIGKHGTRHSAGLGLSEVCDALSLIVSEEKGTISICRDGKLKTLQDYDELEKELDKFINTKISPKKESFYNHFIKHNFILKISALVFATVLWYFLKH